MAKTKIIPSSSKIPSKRRSKNLGVSKQSKGKERGNGEIEILFVRADGNGRHYGCSSLNPTRYILAPISVSRADGDLEKNSPPSSPRPDDDNVFTMPKPYDFDGPLRFNFGKDTTRHNALSNKGKWSLPLLYPDIGDLEKLEVYEEIRTLLGNSGLSFIFVIILVPIMRSL